MHPYKQAYQQVYVNRAVINFGSDERYAAHAFRAAKVDQAQFLASLMRPGVIFTVRYEERVAGDSFHGQELVDFIMHVASNYPLPDAAEANNRTCQPPIASSAAPSPCSTSAPTPKSS